MNDLINTLTEGVDFADSPSGSYRKVMCGKKAAAWLIDGKAQVRLILRTGHEAEPPAVEGMWREAKTGDPQLKVTTANRKDAAKWIAWAVKRTEERIVLAEAAKPKPTAKKPKAPKLTVVSDPAEAVDAAIAEKAKVEEPRPTRKPRAKKEPTPAS